MATAASPVTVGVLGAGAMGSALTTPAASNGHAVRLWGTWLDDAIVADLRGGRPHPRIDVLVDRRVEVFDASGLGEALRDADVVALAISSEGVVEVLRRAVPYLHPGQPVLMVTKGFSRDTSGRIRLFPDLLKGVLPDHLRDRNPIVAVGGPCKANEVAAGRPTATVYASSDPAAAERCRRVFQTQQYCIETTQDVVGLEVAAALKNVFAIALGVCEGLEQREDSGSLPWHNLKAAAFARAVAEMATIAHALGGDPATVVGLPGTGDLEVTALSGRNKVFGVRVGRGEHAPEAYEAMQRAGQTVEGVPAARLAIELVEQEAAAGRLRRGAFPLLDAVVQLLDGVTDLADLLASASLPGRDAGALR